MRRCPTDRQVEDCYLPLSRERFSSKNFNFSTVILNASTGSDSATLDDDTDNDTFNASGNTAELVCANNYKIRLLASDPVTSNGNERGVNRKNVNNPLVYQLRFVGNWV